MICMGSFAISNSQYPESRGTFGSAIAKIPATYIATPGLIPAEPFSELDQLGRRNTMMVAVSHPGNAN